MSAIPSTWIVPGWYSKLDASANIGEVTGAGRLIIAQKIAAGTATVEVPVTVASVAQSITLFGQGSQAHLMCKATLAQNVVTPLTVIPIADGTTAATGTIEVTVTTAVAGSLHLRIGGQKVLVSVEAADADTVIAASIVAAVTALPDLPVTAGAVAELVTLTAKNKGLLGNSIDVQENYFGLAGGEVTAGGVTLAIVAMGGVVAGATDPTLSGAIAAMGDTAYDYICSPYTDATVRALFTAEMNDGDAGRWGPLRQVYGHVFSADVDTYANLITLGGLNNDQHLSIFGLPTMPTPKWEVAAAMMGRAARSLSTWPANPIEKAPLVGVLGPKPADRFSAVERNALLTAGIATANVDDNGNVRVEFCVTTSQTDAAGNPSSTYRQVQTLATNQAMMRRWRTRSQRYDEYTVVADDRRIRAGITKVTTLEKIVNNVFIGGYREFIGLGWAERMDEFKAALAGNYALVGGRVVATLPPDLANPLRQFDITIMFRLDFGS